MTTPWSGDMECVGVKLESNLSGPTGDFISPKPSKGFAVRIVVFHLSHLALTVSVQTGNNGIYL